MRKTFTRFLLVLFMIFPSVVFSQREKKIDSLEKLMKVSKDTIRVRVALDLAYHYQGVNTDTALKYAMLAKQESEGLGFQKGEALSYKMLASVYYNRGEQPKAEKLALIALEKLQLIGTIVEQADVTNSLGLIFMTQAKYYQAEKYFKEALYYYIDVDDSVGVVIALHNIGVVNFYRGEYDKVARYYSNSLRLAEKLHNEKFITVNLINLGILFNVQSDFNKAKQYIKRGLLNYRNENERKGEAEALAHLGTVYFNEGSMDSSLFCHQQALVIEREVKDDGGISQALSNIGDIMVEQGQYEKARTFYLESIDIRKKNDDQYGLTLSYVGMAKVNYATGKPEIAQQYFDSALVLSKNIGSIWRTAEIYQEIASFNGKQGNYKMAFEALQHYSSVKDTLFSREKTEVAHELEAQYETEKTNKDLLIQKAKVKILRRANGLFIFSLIALGLIVVLITLLGITWYNRTRIRNQKNLEIAEKNRLLSESRQQTMQAELERSKAEQERILSELNFKKKELTQLALHINQQNDFLESLKNNLKEVTSSPEVKSLERELDAKINLDKQREDFELNIDLINEDFYRKLSEKFPLLSENEKKLCAMLRLNLSSKEIAAIQNISSKSVDMNRYRMRKKLNISNEADLGKFLSEV